MKYKPGFSKPQPKIEEVKRKERQKEFDEKSLTSDAKKEMFGADADFLDDDMGCK